MKEPCDWVISRGEIHLTDTRLGAGVWGEVVLGRFRGSKVAVKKSTSRFSQITIDVCLKEK